MFRKEEEIERLTSGLEKELVRWEIEEILETDEERDIAIDAGRLLRLAPAAPVLPLVHRRVSESRLMSEYLSELERCVATLIGMGEDDLSEETIEEIDRICAAVTFLGYPEMLAGDIDKAIEALKAWPELFAELQGFAVEFLANQPPLETDPVLRLWQTLTKINERTSTKQEGHDVTDLTEEEFEEILGF